jgi:hypothetical protein
MPFEGGSKSFREKVEAKKNQQWLNAETTNGTFSHYLLLKLFL